MKKKLIAMFLSIIIMSMVLTTTAFAGISGYYWTSNPQYYVSTSSPYYSSIINAISSWNTVLANSGSSIRLTSTGSLTSANVNVGSTDYGYTAWKARCTTMHSGWVITASSVNFNTYWMDQYINDGNHIRFIACHEFGHVLGLDDNQYNTPRTLLYMYDNYPSWGIYTPQTTDINEIYAIY